MTIYNLERYKILLISILYYIMLMFICAMEKSTTVFVGIFKYLPDFDLLFIYYIFFIMNFNHFFYIHLLLFGFILDTFTFLPVGVSSLTLLITYKLYFIARSFTFNVDNDIFCNLRDLFIFYFIFFISRWFILSIYNTNFLSIFEILKLIFKNVFYSLMFFIIRNNRINNNG